MKKAILTITIAGFLAACNESPKLSDRNTVTQKVAEDTTGLSQFKQWKEQQQVVNNAEVLDEETQNFNATSLGETQQSPRIIVHETADERPAPKKARRAPSKIQTSGDAAPEPVAKTESRPVRTRTESSSNGEAAPTAGSGTAASDGDVAATQPETEQQKKKEGWSEAAKGTAVGAGSGAVLGAIISKKKGKGAIIGGVVGAAGGYVLGRSKDKKEGRN
jgi:hypothetical protein